MDFGDLGLIFKLLQSLEIPRGPRTGSSRGPCIARLSTEPVLAIHYCTALWRERLDRNVSSFVTPLLYSNLNCPEYVHL